jgi:hypothetical protein
MRIAFCMLSLFVLAGCGNQNESGKTTQAAEAPKANTSERTQETRAPSTSTKAEQSGTAAPETGRSIQAPTPPIISAPATLHEALKVIDFRQMQNPENADVKIVGPTELFYSAPGTIADTAAYCKKKYQEMGWVEDEVKMPGLDPAKNEYAGFDKAGFHATLSVSKSKKEGWVDVSMTNLGNVDPRRLPRPADAKPTFDFWHYVSYATASKPQEVIELCGKELTAKGWKQYAVSNAKFHAKEGRFLAGFANNAMDLFINAKAEADGKSTIEYRTSIREKPAQDPKAAMLPAAKFDEGIKSIDLNTFPRLPDAEEGKGSSAVLYYEGPGDVAKAVAFYRAKLKEAGWVEEPRKTVDEIGDFATIDFDKAGFHLEMQVNKGDKPNRVNVHLENKGNVDVRQFARLADAAVGGLEGFSDVLYDTETKPDVATDFYRKELTGRGWEELKSESKDYPDGSKSLVFEQNAMILTIRIDKDSIRLQTQLIGESPPKPPAKK